MLKQVIAIDIDDVIADTTNALRLAANAVAGVDLQPEHYLVEGEYWGYYEMVWAQNKIDHVVSFATLHDDMALDQNHVRIMAGAKEAIKKLHTKYRIVAITSRNVKWVKATENWVKTHFPGVFDQVVFVHHDNNDRRTKGDACLKVGASWLIDDNYEHCESAINAGVTALLFGDYGWNRRHQNVDNVRSVKNWQEVLEYFENEF